MRVGGFQAQHGVGAGLAVGLAAGPGLCGVGRCLREKDDQRLAVALEEAAEDVAGGEETAGRLLRGGQVAGGGDGGGIGAVQAALGGLQVRDAGLAGAAEFGFEGAEFVPTDEGHGVVAEGGAFGFGDRIARDDQEAAFQLFGNAVGSAEGADGGDVVHDADADQADAAFGDEE